MLSYSKGHEFPFFEGTISDALRQTTEHLPDHEALVVCHQNVRLTFAELSAEVERTARGLSGLGLRAQDRIGGWSTYCVEWVLMQVACARIGAVLVNVKPAYRAYELAFVLRKSGMRALFLWEKDKRSDYREILEEARRGQSPALEHVIYFGTESWRQMLGRGVPINTGKNACAINSDVTNIQYTSGTTGSPKGVLLTHRNLLNNAAVISEGMKITPRDRICVPVPL